MIILVSNSNWNLLSFLYMCKNFIGFNVKLNKMYNIIVYYLYIYVCIYYIVCDNDLEY